MTETESLPDTRQATILDRYIGQRVKHLREQLCISQVKVSEMLGISFQQVQKYERGANRISASRLFELSHHFGVDITYFFDGAHALLPPRALVRQPAELSQVSATSFLKQVVEVTGSNRLLSAYVKIDGENKRKKAIELVELIASE